MHVTALRLHMRNRKTRCCNCKVVISANPGHCKLQSQSCNCNDKLLQRSPLTASCNRNAAILQNLTSAVFAVLVASLAPAASCNRNAAIAKRSLRCSGTAARRRLYARLDAASGRAACPGSSTRPCSRESAASMLPFAVALLVDEVCAAHKCLTVQASLDARAPARRQDICHDVDFASGGLQGSVALV